MKISKKILQFVAGVALCCSCNTLLAEIIEDAKSPDFIFVKSYATLRSNSDDSREMALLGAELKGLQEFVNHAVTKNVILPDSLLPLRKQIESSLFVKYYTGTINGSKVLRSMILKDGRACCVLEIPRKNLENFPKLDFKKDPSLLLDNVENNAILKNEIGQILGIKTPELFSSSQKSFLCVKNMPLKSIPELWAIKDIQLENLDSLKDSELLFCFETFLGQTDKINSIIDEVKNRGYTQTSKMLSEIKIPQLDVLKGLENIAEPEKSSVLVRVLLNYRSSIKFENSDVENENFDNAMLEFSSKNPDFSKAGTLAVKSLTKSVSDRAFNLIGRCYEEEGNFVCAILCYAQAVSINQNTPYAKANLAKCFYKLNDFENAKYWAEETLKSQNLVDWSKNLANEILNLMKEKK